MERIPLVDAEGVIGEHFDAFHIAQGGDKVTGTLKVLIDVRDTRDQDLTDPDRYVVVREPPQCFKNVCVGMSGKLLVLNRISARTRLVECIRFWNSL